MDFVTIFKALGSADAQVIRSRLEAANFHPFLPDDSDPLALGVGGIRIQVPAEEAADAKEFLES